MEYGTILKLSLFYLTGGIEMIDDELAISVLWHQRVLKPLQKNLDNYMEKLLIILVPPKVGNNYYNQ